ncbi:hypothetical protein ACX27_14985 [Nostoc piscinale CENA21]|uniref:Uncharacterized protein n=1 Tax=Nostoc piscinale CENA21 TaxID=224013 RepID=A0A0M4SXS5_9NOSO|nr:hypothetical protein ACX27_14985 [Nostoc piscinale CENA21]
MGEIRAMGCSFFIEQTTKTKIGKTRKIKRLVGELTLKTKQLQKLGVKPRSRLSPLLQKCCLRLSALKKILPFQAKVYCDGKLTVIPTLELVSGDVTQ